MLKFRQISTQQYSSKFLTYPFWMKDFLTDPRVFHNIAFTLRKSRKNLSLLRELDFSQALYQKPPLALTFDIERDMTEPFESSESITAEVFLRHFLEFNENKGLKATFFVQGQMVPKLAKILLRARNQGHEVGLHGYSHELWGRNNWITRRLPITPSERERRLELSLCNFEEAGLPRPIAFRAPNFTIDELTYRLLKKKGFKVDSSSPTQRGNFNSFPVLDGIRSVPVSSSPVPEVYVNPFLKVKTALSFTQLHYEGFVQKQLTSLSEVTKLILSYQLANNIKPHLVTYAHNWEFYRQNITDKSNVEKLFEQALYFVDRFNMQSLTISQTADFLYKESS